MSEKYAESLQKALKSLQIADHMAYVTFPVMNDRRLLLKVLENVSESFINAVNAILQYEYANKRIKLYNDPILNLKIFTEKCAPRYNIRPEEAARIIEVLEIWSKHKKSAIEFARKDNLVIMADNFKTDILSIEKIRGYLTLAKSILQKASNCISHHQ
mgnify:FL=1